MADNNHIPETERKLAKQVQSVLEEKGTLLSIDDPLMDEIVNHKKSLYFRYEHELSESKVHSWNKISSSIQNDISGNPQNTKASSPFKYLNSQKSLYLKVAAALLLAALLSIIYLQLDFSKEQLLVEAESNQVTYTLGDESRIQLRPKSRLFITGQSAEEVRYKLEGEAFFNVTKNGQRRFLVDTRTGIVEVLGTSFNIREWNNKTVVYLQDGSLSLSTSNQTEKVTLNPGEAASVTADSVVAQPFQTDGEQYTSWQQNEIILNNRTVQSIVEELEYHYSIEILVPQNIQDEVLGGRLTLENRNLSLENLGIVLGGNFSSIEGNTYQFVE
ncbi:FecR family protein [Rhodohalobacter sulfatireducens]|uniref:FecR domain-containing protein n=1 Tax=Rhodohalobacter sulfatireducens TaxID=2911366 RepID=A0ABS9KAD4_9BACT|nr:FecR domain-containing protein [Rhodohalobacter sulfatireducens]MCG2587817.1 FecR domain-containing protein [Rhodohalobacter sulfatireducens]